MNKKAIIFFTIAIFLLSAISINLAAKDTNPVPKKALKLEKKGDKATKKKEYDKAMELYKQALEIYNNIDTVHYKIASIHAFNKNFAEALKELKTTLEINGENQKAKLALVDTTLKYGNKLLRSRKIEDANKLFIDFIGLDWLKTVDPKLLTEMKYRIGFNFFQLRKSNESNKFLLGFINDETSTQLFPKYYSMANYLIGLNFSQAKDVNNSNKYLSKFVELNKEDQTNRYLGFAKYILGMNNFNKLKTTIDKIEKTTTRKNLNSNRKKIVSLASEEKGIEDNLLFAIEKNPNLENAYVLLGNYYYLKKDIVNSIKYYKSLVEKFAGSPDIEVYKVFLKDLLRQQKEK